MWCRASILAEKWLRGSCGPTNRRNAPKKAMGMPKPQQRGKKDIKSPIQICKPDFSSSFMVKSQVAGWCVGRARRWKPQIFLEGKVLLIRVMLGLQPKIKLSDSVPKYSINAFDALNTHT